MTWLDEVPCNTQTIEEPEGYTSQGWNDTVPTGQIGSWAGYVDHGASMPQVVDPASYEFQLSSNEFQPVEQSWTMPRIPAEVSTPNEENSRMTGSVAVDQSTSFTQITTTTVHSQYTYLFHTQGAS